MGQGSFDADTAYESAQSKFELLRAISDIRNKDSNENQFTRKNYPNQPLYVLYQNHLMQDKNLSSKERQDLSKQAYIKARLADVGTEIHCPGCNQKFVKRTYQHVYCSDQVQGRSTCKDFINNWFNPVKAFKEYQRKQNTETKRYKEVQEFNMHIQLIEQWLQEGKITKENLQSVVDSCSN